MKPSLEHFSYLIERIYDCALDPSRWPATMADICGEYGFAASTILLVDLRTSEQRQLADWNAAPEYQRHLRERLASEAASMFRAAVAVQAEIDEPMVLSRGPFDRAAFRSSRMYLEWAKPQGWADFINVAVLREPQLVGTLSVAQREIDGDVTDEQIEVMRLLAPHLRRAVTVSNIMDLKEVQQRALSATLDSLASGVLLVDRDGRLFHANKAAEAMLRRGQTIRVVQGRVTGASRAETAELTRAIALASTDEPNIGTTGIGIPLDGTDGSPGSAHVLPLARGPLRPNLMPGATAAVFLSSAERHISLAGSAVVYSYKLTEAETAMLELLVNGRNLDEAAGELGIARTTAKTHLMHIYTKTGVSRQADLLTLVMRLVPPIKNQSAEL